VFHDYLSRPKPTIPKDSSPLWALHPVLGSPFPAALRKMENAFFAAPAARTFTDVGSARVTGSRNDEDRSLVPPSAQRRLRVAIFDLYDTIASWRRGRDRRTPTPSSGQFDGLIGSVRRTHWDNQRQMWWHSWRYRKFDLDGVILRLSKQEYFAPARREFSQL